MVLISKDEETGSEKVSILPYVTQQGEAELGLELSPSCASSLSQL